MTNTDGRGRAHFSRGSECCADGCGRFRTGLNSLVGAPGRNRTAAKSAQGRTRQTFTISEWCLWALAGGLFLGLATNAHRSTKEALAMGTELLVACAAAIYLRSMTRAEREVRSYVELDSPRFWGA